METIKQTVLQGLWHKNPALTQMLGLCPLLAVSNSVVNALGLSLATIFVLVSSNGLISITRNIVPKTIRLPIFVIIIATLTTCSELIMRAFSLELHQILGIFIPLIVTNCMILGRAEAFASRQKVFVSLIDGFTMGVGFGIVLVVLGIIREILGNGTIFSNMHLIFGDVIADWPGIYITDQIFILMALPPGAFIALGFLMATKQAIDEYQEKVRLQSIEIRSKRIRTTEI